MYYNIKVNENIHWVGVNDRRKSLFENMWPLPHGVSYNSYLLIDKKTALMDTVEMGTDGRYIERIKTLLNGRKLDYLVINHMEPDHSGEIVGVVKQYPDLEVVGNKKTIEFFKTILGDITSNFLEVEDGQTLSLGVQTLRFVTTPWVHWPETMMTYEESAQVLFSGDAFGTFGTLDGGVMDSDVRFDYYEDEMRRYYSNIVGKYGTMVQRALAKFTDTPIKTICSLHGPVWQEHVDKVISLYDKWSLCEADDAVVVIYGSMYGGTEAVAEYIAHKISENGVKDIRVYDASKTHSSYLISEIWRCRGVVFGSCAYNTKMLPPMEQLCSDMLAYGLKDRYLGLFGTCSWSGGGVRNLKVFAENIGWNQPSEPVEVKGKPNNQSFVECDVLAKAIAQSVLSNE